MTTWLDNLATSPRIVHSQCGEEGVLEAIFAGIGTANRYLVDIGAGDGVTLSNTKLFMDAGWNGTRLDGAYSGAVHQERVTAENIVALLDKYGVPQYFDLLSLDIDGVDWYVLRAILRARRPRVFVCEINNSLPAWPPKTVVYDPAMVFANSDYFGASLGAFNMLAEAHGYTLVHCLPWNAFYVRSELVPQPAPVVTWSPSPSWPADPAGRPWAHVTTDMVP